MDEQHAIDRIGKLTASMFHLAVAETRTGWSASREKYLSELVIERFNRVPTERYQSPEMRRGTELEPQARDAYSFMRDVDIQLCGFVPHPTIPLTGCSPDGLIGDDGLVEFKCPSSHTHMRTLRGAKPPGEYLMQCMWQLACTGRDWCDLVSFDPRWPIRMQLHITRIGRSDIAIKKMEEQAKQFLMEVALEQEALRQQYLQEAA